MAVVKGFGEEYPYILKEDRKKKKTEQTIWWHKIADLDQQQLGGDIVEFEGDPTDNRVTRTIVKPNRKGVVDILTSCLVRVENLKNEKGEDVQWPTASQPRKEFLAVLPPAWRAELAMAFKQISTVSEEQVKN